MYFSKFEEQFCAVNDTRKDEFAQNFPLLDNKSVHARWKKGSWQITRIGEIWRRSGKVFSVPYEGIDAYPSFQFAEDGTPLPLMETVLKALPADMSPWQRAFWMISPKAELGGENPASSIQTGDNRVVDVASKFGGDFLN
ncbi:hypothetical protein [Ruegeria arenilitoris]|uniref:hypothetical protein n=1 Tax=Ruegeria arenilitoris TaxID=1173585 RepID=UPI001480737B|nr:hypothetical protein [Ruegeria arenilitoris]